MIAPPGRYNTRKAAFTLVELLVAVSITAIVIVLLSRVFSATSSQWQAADQRVDAFRDARIALQVMARDLGRANINGEKRMLTLSNIDSSGNYAQEAFAITPSPNPGKSDLSALGYYCTWNGTTKTYTLKRLLRDSDRILPWLQTLNFGSMFAKDSNFEEDVAAYVWDLRFYPGIKEQAVQPASTQSTDWNWIEIRFKAMSPQSARKIRGMNVNQNTWAPPPAGQQPSDTYKAVILPYEQQFVTRVVLQQNR